MGDVEIADAGGVEQHLRRAESRWRARCEIRAHHLRSPKEKNRTAVAAPPRTKAAGERHAYGGAVAAPGVDVRLPRSVGHVDDPLAVRRPSGIRFVEAAIA